MQFNFFFLQQMCWLNQTIHKMELLKLENLLGTARDAIIQFSGRVNIAVQWSFHSISFSEAILLSCAYYNVV